MPAGRAKALPLPCFTPTAQQFCHLGTAKGCPKCCLDTTLHFCHIQHSSPISQIHHPCSR